MHQASNTTFQSQSFVERLSYFLISSTVPITASWVKKQKTEDLSTSKGRKLLASVWQASCWIWLDYVRSLQWQFLSRKYGAACEENIRCLCQHCNHYSLCFFLCQLWFICHLLPEILYLSRYDCIKELSFGPKIAVENEEIPIDLSPSDDDNRQQRSQMENLQSTYFL